MSTAAAIAHTAEPASVEVAHREVAEHLLLVTTAHPSLHQHPDPDGQAVHRNLGRLLQPRHTSSAELTALAGIPWAADNDCFQGLDPKKFVAMLDRLQGVPGCRFVTVPDVVGDAFETAKQFEKWAPALERRGLPVALVLQNGIDRPALRRWLDRTWHRLDAVFVGGDDEFKLGPVAAELAREAKRRGLWVHWGRVNSRKRMKHCIETGACDSVDGSMWARFRKTHLDKGLRWLVELTEERRLRDAQIGLMEEQFAPAPVLQLSTHGADNSAIMLSTRADHHEEMSHMSITTDLRHPGRLTHTTVDGTRYGIDADGRVTMPDADGTGDQLVLGRVRRDVANTRVWTWDPGEEEGIVQDAATRAEAIRELRARFDRQGAPVSPDLGTGSRAEGAERYRAVHRGSLKTIAVGTAEELLMAIPAAGQRYADVALYRSLEGPATGMVHAETCAFLSAAAAAGELDPATEVVPVHELREGDRCVTRDGRVVVYTRGDGSYGAGNAREVCGIGTLARRLRSTVVREEEGEDAMRVERITFPIRYAGGAVWRKVEVEHTTCDGATTTRVFETEFETNGDVLRERYEVRDPAMVRHHVRRTERS